MTIEETNEKELKYKEACNSVGKLIFVLPKLDKTHISVPTKKMEIVLPEPKKEKVKHIPEIITI